MARLTGSLERTRSSRSAFTLVELMVVAAIIAILASMALGGMVMARRSANVDRTKATIAKIDSVIRPMYDEYKNRRVPVPSVLTDPLTNEVVRLDPKESAMVRLTALRDLMRLEMPERDTDISRGPITIRIRNGVASVPTPSLHSAYSAKRGVGLGTHGPAEALYLVVTIGGGEDARRLFNDSEIADTDGDGLMEFVDGFGKPIYWLRWAPGFAESDVQPNVTNDAEGVAAANTDHDPFDSRKIDVKGAGAGDYARGWRLAPLIYSAGPDGEYGIGTDTGSGSPYEWGTDSAGRPSKHYQAMWGKPADSNGETRLDNVHNHIAP